MLRKTSYTGELVQSPDFLQIQKNNAIALAYLTQTVLGSTGIVQGLNIIPTTPLSHQVAMSPGSMYQLTTADPTAWSDLPIDSHTEVYQGINRDLLTLPTDYAAPVIPNSQICYTLQAQLVVTDENPKLLPFFDSANPTQPIYGPLGTGALMNTDRDYAISTDVLTGSPIVFPVINSGELTTGSAGTLTSGNYFLIITYVYTGDIESGPSNELEFSFGTGVTNGSVAYDFGTLPSGVTQINVYITDADGPSGSEKFNQFTTTGSGTIIAPNASLANPVPKHAPAPPVEMGFLGLAIVCQTAGEGDVTAPDIFDIRPTTLTLPEATGSSTFAGVHSLSSAGGILVNGTFGPVQGDVTIGHIEGHTLDNSGMNVDRVDDMHAQDIINTTIADILPIVVDQIIPGPGINVSPSSGQGIVTVSVAGTGVNSAQGIQGILVDGDTAAHTGAIIIGTVYGHTLDNSGLNADRVDNLHAQDIINAAIAAVGKGRSTLSCFTPQGIAGSSYPPAAGGGGLPYFIGSLPAPCGLGSRGYNDGDNPLSAAQMGYFGAIIPYSGTLSNLFVRGIAAGNGQVTNTTASVAVNAGDRIFFTKVSGSAPGTSPIIFGIYLNGALTPLQVQSASTGVGVNPFVLGFYNITSVSVQLQAT